MAVDISARHPLPLTMALNFVGSPDFSPSQLPPARHSTSGSRRSRTTSLAGSLDHRLSIIEEDHASSSPPISPLHPKTHNRPFSRRFLGEPPRYSSGHSPPRYTFWEVTGPKGEKFEDLRNNAYVARRGGWKRICLFVWLIIILVLALAIGLGVGLSKNRNNKCAFIKFDIRG